MEFRYDSINKTSMNSVQKVFLKLSWIVGILLLFMLLSNSWIKMNSQRKVHLFVHKHQQQGLGNTVILVQGKGASNNERQALDGNESKNAFSNNKPKKMNSTQLVKGKSREFMKLETELKMRTNPVALKLRATQFPPNSSMCLFLRTQEARRRHIAEVCSEDDVQRSIIPATASIFVEKVNKLAFCSVYKAASSTWLHILFEIKGISRDKISKYETRRVANHFFKNVANVLAPGMTKTDLKFLVVRHPLERLVSCYRDKFELASKAYYYGKYGEAMVISSHRMPDPSSYEKRRLLLKAVMDHVKHDLPLNNTKYNPYAHPIGPTFQEFTQYISMLNKKRDDEHWRPYINHCNVCRMKYEFILRFENMNSEGKVFLNYLNRSELIEPRWDNPTSKGITTNEVTCKYFSQIGTKLYDRIIKKYELDFRLFDYDPLLYKNCVKKDSDL